MKVFNLISPTEKADDCCVKTKVTEIIKHINAKTCGIKLYEMQPGGLSPLHSHSSQHIVIVLDGEGLVFNGEKTIPIQSDDIVLIKANEQHQFKNNGTKPFKFLNVIIE